MALQLNGDEFKKIRNTFREIDKDGNGKLSWSEIKDYYKDTDDTVAFIMKLMDMDSNGFVEFHEYLEIVALLQYQKGVEDWKCKQLFLALDKEETGSLSSLDIKLFIKMISKLNADMRSDEEIEDLIEPLDTNDDGNIPCDLPLYKIIRLYL